MATVADTFSNFYNYTLNSRDPRSAKWMLSDPISLLCIDVLYLLFCLYIGPWYMKNRPPYKLRRLISAYNIFQVALNTFLVHEGIHVMFFNDFDFRCQGVDFSETELALRITRDAWWFLISRLTDMVDTVFFVLRKKTANLSFLHIYHHSLMALGSWLCAIYFPGGNAVVVGALNSFVHVLMYSYYFITSLGPKYKRYIWWKKYLTQLQIIQFVIVGSHAFRSLFYDCAFPKILMVLLFINALFFIRMFGQFYVRSYLRPKSDQKKD